MRRAVATVGAAAILGLVSGCFALSGPEIAPAPPLQGPTLVMVVTNRSSEHRSVEFEYEAPGTSGAGGGDVPCGTIVMDIGAVTGTYRLVVEGAEVASGRVPGGADPSSFLVFEIVIEEDGTADVAGPVVAQRAPQAPPPERC